MKLIGSRLGRRFGSFSVYRKADSFVIPTLSCGSRAVLGGEHSRAPNFNPANAFRYSSKPAGPEAAERAILNKVLLDVSPNYEEFLAYARRASQVSMTYINVTSQDYFVLAKLIEQDKRFPNIVVTVENPRLTEEEVAELYESINHPIYIGMNLGNSRNFRETAEETGLRRYLKEMFKYSGQIKLIEIELPILQRLCDNVDPSRPKPAKKHASLKTLIDFVLLSQFKGFLDVSLTAPGHPHQPDAEAELLGYLTKLDQYLLEKGFTVHKMTKEEVFQVVHHIRPDNSDLLIATSY